MPEANNCFSINTQVIISKKRKKKHLKRVPYTLYVKRDGAIYFLVNRDLKFFLFVIRD